MVTGAVVGAAVGAVVGAALVGAALAGAAVTVGVAADAQALKSKPIVSNTDNTAYNLIFFIFNSFSLV
jgi:hypothetical protein